MLRTALQFVAISFVASVPAAAIIMRHDVAESRYRDLGEQYRQYLVQLALTDDKGAPSLYDGNGTLIAPKWVLTARHAARLIRTSKDRPHYVYVNGQGYPVDQVYLAAGDLKSRDGRYATNDAALLKLGVPVKLDEYPCLYRQRHEKGMRIVVAGTGLRGNGRTGVGEPDGALRGATQTIDGVGYNGDESVIWFNFNRPGTRQAMPLEGISGPGDSGGPAFARLDGRLCIVGISSGQDEKGGPEGRYGVTEYYTRVSSYFSWIQRILSD